MVLGLFTAVTLAAEGTLARCSLLSEETWCSCWLSSTVVLPLSLWPVPRAVQHGEVLVLCLNHNCTLLAARSAWISSCRGDLSLMAKVTIQSCINLRLALTHTDTFKSQERMCFIISVSYTMIQWMLISHDLTILLGYVDLESLRHSFKLKFSANLLMIKQTNVHTG